MKKIILVLCVLMILFAQCYDVSAWNVYTGNELVAKWREFKRGFNSESDLYFDSGTYAGYVVGVAEFNSNAFPSRISIPNGVSIDQLCRVVGKYLEEHPELWAEAALILVMQALLEAFPNKHTQGQ